MRTVRFVTTSISPGTQPQAVQRAAAFASQLHPITARHLRLHARTTLPARDAPSGLRLRSGRTANSTSPGTTTARTSSLSIALSTEVRLGDSSAPLRPKLFRSTYAFPQNLTEARWSIQSLTWIAPTARIAVVSTVHGWIKHRQAQPTSFFHTPTTKA